MKGNQGRRGAMRPRKPASSRKGSGGKHRRALEGKGPTPKAEDRTYHQAHQAKRKREKAAEVEAQKTAARNHTRVRLQPGNELIVGRNPVIEAAKAGLQIERIYLSADPGDGRMREVVAELSTTGAPYLEVMKRDLDIASDYANHQGVGIEVAEYDYQDLDEVLERAVEGNELLVALDHVTDPHNVGAVLRSGAAFGVDGLILPERRSAGIGVTAWKVSAGAAAKVPAARVTNLVSALERCKAAGFFVVGLDGGAQQSIRSFPLATEPLVLVTGAEGKGLSRLVAETCDMIVSIPMGDMESLNAAVAAGIALFEIAQQREETE